jgi:hypothetical protein
MLEFFVEVVPEQDIVVRAESLEEARAKARVALLESTLDLWITRSYALEEFDAVTELEQTREKSSGRLMRSPNAAGVGLNWR